MAVEKYTYLDQAGVLKLASTLLKAENTRIKERILTAVNAAAYSDSRHVLAASAILNLLGSLDAYAIAQGETGAMTGEEATILGKMKALQLAIGTSTDASTDDTVYGAIQGVRENISALTHLTYQTVTGPIATAVPMAMAKDDVLYLQHDNPSMAVGRDGYLLNDQNEKAYVELEGVRTYAYSAPDGTLYKATEDAGVFTVSNDVWADGSAIYGDGVVQMVEDSTYNLYIAQLTKVEGVTTDVEWICVGDTSLDLANYWDKSDASVRELQNKIVGNLSDATIESTVQAAFDATDPYTGDGSYLDSWLESGSGD